jgi:hypothetical protein
VAGRAVTLPASGPSRLGGGSAVGACSDDLAPAAAGRRNGVAGCLAAAACMDASLPLSAAAAPVAAAGATVLGLRRGDLRARGLLDNCSCRGLLACKGLRSAHGLLPPAGLSGWPWVVGLLRGSGLLGGRALLVGLGLLMGLTGGVGHLCGVGLAGGTEYLGGKGGSPALRRWDGSEGCS